MTNNNSDLATVIKSLAIQGVEATKPCEIRYGEVVSDDPFLIKITDNFVLPERLLIIPDIYRNRLESKAQIESYQDWQDNTTHYTTTIQSYQNDNSLKIYDQVIMIREQGGQKYIVVGRF